MTVELTAFGTYFAQGMALIENKTFSLLGGTDLRVHLFDDQKLAGVVLRADGAHALIQIDEERWWLERNRNGQAGRWIVRARRRAASDRLNRRPPPQVHLGQGGGVSHARASSMLSKRRTGRSSPPKKFAYRRSASVTSAVVATAATAPRGSNAW